MKTPYSLLPDLPTLTAGLTAALSCSTCFVNPVQVVKRKRPQMMCTFPNEIVACRRSDGSVTSIFVKYGMQCGHNAYGHRGNVRYEADVYRRVLQLLPDFRPQCLGVHTNESTGETWLILEHVDRSVRLSDVVWKKEDTRLLAAMLQVTRWIARFHRLHERSLASADLGFLIRYDASYLRNWALRSLDFARPLHRQFPWLNELCRRCDQWSEPLLRAPQTVIHGELYVKQILLRNGTPFFIDWESAAMGAGEIDLATLTEGNGWSGEIVTRCEEEYQRARWPEGAPADFPNRLDAARIYLHFRWLGERPDWTVREKSLWRYESLYLATKRLGLL